MSRLLPCLLALSCAPKAAPPPPPSLPAAEAARTAAAPLGAEPSSGELVLSGALVPASAAPGGPAIGGAGLGFVAWLSADASMALLVRWPEGPVPTFSRAGQPDRSPELVLVSTRGAQERKVDAWLAPDPSGRRAAVLWGERLLVASSAGGEVLDLASAGADLEPDRNRCMPGRQLSWDPLGQQVAWIMRGPERLRVRDLSSGKEKDYPAEGRIWRGAPLGQELVLLREVKSGRSEQTRDGEAVYQRLAFPVQQSGCTWPWAERFASGLRSYGWEGPSVRVMASDASGLRAPMGEGAVALGGGRWWEPERKVVASLENEDLPLPEGCSHFWPVPGAGAGVLSCGGEKSWLWTGEGSARKLDALVRPVHQPATAFLGEDGEVWSPVWVGEGERQRIGRLRPRDGRIDVGPAAESAGELGPDGELLVWGRAGTVALDLRWGRSWSLPGLALEQGTGSAGRRSDGRSLVVNAESGGILALEAGAHPLVAEGCFLQGTGAEGPLERGPWTLMCVGKPGGPL